MAEPISESKLWQGTVKSVPVSIVVDDDLLHDIVGWAVGFEYALGYTPLISDHAEDHLLHTIAYWCDQITAVCPKDVDMEPRDLIFDGYSNEELLSHVSRGGILKIHDAVSHQIYDLDKEKLADGVMQAFTAYQNRCETAGYEPVDIVVFDKDENEYKIELNEQVADMAFQFALFGEVRYTRDTVTMNGAIRVWMPEHDEVE